MIESMIAIVRKAGALALHYHGDISESQVEHKSRGVKDLVTFVDREVETLIVNELKAAFPDHAIEGEESGALRDGSARFLVDPIDGTANYVQGLPHFGVTIARIENGVTTHGVIFSPVLNEMYHAVRGGGAFMNGQPIHVSTRNEMLNCMIATGFACVRAGIDPDGVPIFSQLIYKVRDIRRLGAATLDLAYTARGIFDGFYEMALEPWDVSAGALMVEEAGGAVSGFMGDNHPYRGEKIMASNGLIHDELKRLIEEALTR